jgi:hypothetical protein
MLVKMWKNAGAKYRDGVELLKEYAPNHPLLPVLLEGHSVLNQLYLEEAIDTIRLDQTSTQHPAPNTKKDEATDLIRQLKELLHAKAIRRNEFLDFGMRTDKHANAARVNINADLIEMRKKIHQLSNRKAYYEKTGELPKIPEIPPISSEIKGDNFALQKKLFNLRANISKYKKKIRVGYAGNADAKKISFLEIKLKSLENDRDIIQNTINQQTTAEANDTGGI